MPELVVKLIGNETITGYLLVQAARFRSCHQQSHLSRNLPALAVHSAQEFAQDSAQDSAQAGWMRHHEDQTLAKALSLSVQKIREVYASTSSVCDFSWRSECSTAPTRLRACFELMGGNLLAPAPAAKAWKQFNMSAMTRWSQPKPPEGPEVHKSRVPTSDEDPLLLVRGTLQLFAMAVGSSSTADIKDVQAFYRCAATVVQAARAKAQVQAYSIQCHQFTESICC